MGLHSMSGSTNHNQYIAKLLQTGYCFLFCLEIDLYFKAYAVFIKKMTSLELLPQILPTRRINQSSLHVFSLVKFHVGLVQALSNYV